jgi:hypothetical protein
MNIFKIFKEIYKSLKVNYNKMTYYTRMFKVKWINS